MTYTIIGTGNMAWFLAQRLHSAGHRCMGVYGRNASEAMKLAETISAPLIHQIAHIREEMADCCIIAVTDSAISEVAAKLPLQDTVVIHTAGSVPLDAIRTLNSAALWSVYSIRKNDLPQHRNIPVICEAGTQEAQDIVLKIAGAISDVVQQATWQQRQYLHLTAVLSNNFTNHLMAISQELCEKHNLSFSLLLPIIQQTFEQINKGDIVESQTGPARRGDRNTMQRHLLLLQQEPHWRYLYECMSASIENMYKFRDRKKS